MPDNRMPLDADGYPPPGRAWYAAIVLLLVIALSYLDRLVLSILVVPIQSSIGLSDSEIALLLGPAFVVLYAVFGVPMGFLVDRYNRRNILAAGLCIWTAGTAICGLSHSFGGLAVGRALVGLGEACVVPCSFSIVADYFAPHRRGRAVGVVATGLAIGSGLALFGGGFLLNWAQRSGVAQRTAMAIGMPVDPWQIVFMICGLSGIAVLILLATVREPNRIGEHPADAVPVDLRGFLKGNPGPVFLIFAGYVLMTMVQYGVASWTPALMTRKLGIEPAITGYVIGIAMIISTPIGSLVGGSFGDAMRRRRSNGRVLMALLIAPLYIPGVILMTSTYNMVAIQAGIVLTGFSGSLISSSVYASVQDISPPALRGRMLAVYALAHGLIGVMFGAPLVAFVTDFVFADRGRLDSAILYVGGIGTGVACLCFALALRPFARLADGPGNTR